MPKLRGPRILGILSANDGKLNPNGTRKGQRMDILLGCVGWWFRRSENSYEQEKTEREHLRHEKRAPGWLGCIGDYTTQLYGDYDKPL